MTGNAHWGHASASLGSAMERMRGVRARDVAKAAGGERQR